MLKNDKEKIVDILNNTSRDNYLIVFKNIDKKLRRDNELINIFLKNGEIIDFLDKDLLSDELVLMALENYSGAFIYGSNSLKENKHAVLKYIKMTKRSHDILRYINNNLKKDKEFILDLVKIDGEYLDYADETLKDDDEIVRTALYNSVESIRFASDRIKNDYKINFPLLRNNNNIIKYVGDELKDNKDFIEEALKINLKNIEYASERLRNCEDIMLPIIKEKKWLSKYLGSELNNDVQFIFKHDIPFEFISDNLKNDRDFIIKQINQRFPLYNLNMEMLDDKEIMLLALKANKQNITYLTSNLKNDFDFMKEAIKIDSDFWEYVGDDLRENNYFLETILKNEPNLISKLGDIIFPLNKNEKYSLVLNETNELLNKSFNYQYRLFVEIEDALNKNDDEKIMEIIKDYGLINIDIDVFMDNFNKELDLIEDNNEINLKIIDSEKDIKKDDKNSKTRTSISLYLIVVLIIILIFYFYM